ncbi:hypothetical protein [Methylobacterium isbiliense]|jgi:hypothetical protein|uniref:DUF465 domain-containing protein n=1 Tax=Methylobacterium isbiliense TaxID=315478 RepID=A0ABQ4S8W6_9HYPH|nr:hypothetical protein [Methylobacterium isbiliense]MDN3626005.1 hypothetical protein [Methylobacterium isbiliense]GJD99635.1 hypothetical protein GMJLKIPL_1553 [Methylobacterium isbiliense]
MKAHAPLGPSSDPGDLEPLQTMLARLADLETQYDLARGRVHESPIDEALKHRALARLDLRYRAERQTLVLQLAELHERHMSGLMRLRPTRH